MAYAATQTLRGLCMAGVELDCYVAAPASALPDALREERNLRFFCDPPSWEWGRWYSRTPLVSFVTGQLARAVAQGRLAALAARRHAELPYDVLYQFSQTELAWIRRLRKRLPPIALHPQVHAAGELRWHRGEAGLGRRCEPTARRVAVEGMLSIRSWAQRRDVQLARVIVAPSRRFAEHLARDYQLPTERFCAVPNPVDLHRFTPPSQDRPDGRGVLNILFVSRISVRKGVEMVTALSHRLRDLAGEVRIHVVGEHTLWSDYRPLLRDLNTQVATYKGAVEGELPDVYRNADLLIQPAHYEPFALTVAEALASGLPVVASHEVGASEGVDPRCCRIFPAGDVAALESVIRRLLIELREGAAPTLRRLARAEAERLFDPVTVGSRLACCLERAVASPTSTSRASSHPSEPASNRVHGDPHLGTDRSSVGSPTAGAPTQSMV